MAFHTAGFSEVSGFRGAQLADISSTGKADRLLVLRGVDDEASLALAFAAIAARLTRTLFNPVAELFCWTGTGFMVFITASMLWDGQVPSFIESGRSFLAWAFRIAALFFGAMVIMSAAVRYIYGRELIIGAWGCDVSVHSAPDAEHNADVITLARHRVRNALRHSLYEERSCVTAIADWIIKELRQRVHEHRTVGVRRRLQTKPRMRPRRRGD